MTTIFEALRADHDKQRTLMDILVKTSGDSEGRNELFAKLGDELDHHAAAEEQAFYSRLMAEDLTQEKSRHSVAEHKEIDDLLKDLKQTAYDSPGWLPKMKKLRELVVHHLDEEEREVFQMGGKVLSDTQKTELAREYENLRASAQEA